MNASLDLLESSIEDVGSQLQFNTTTAQITTVRGALAFDSVKDADTPSALLSLSSEVLEGGVPELNASEVHGLTGQQLLALNTKDALTCIPTGLVDEIDFSSTLGMTETARGAILAGLNDSQTAALTSSQYSQMGLTVAAGAATDLLNDVVRTKTAADLDTGTELQRLAAVVNDVMELAAGTTTSLTQTDLELLGITDLTAGRTVALLDAIKASNDNGSGVDTLSEIQALVDTTAPTSTVSGIDISADTGSSSTDFITKTAAQTITATLSAGLVAGETLEGSLDGGATWTDVTSMVSGTAVSWTGATLAAGTSSIQFRVTDAAGNSGAAASQSYTLDTTAPTATVSDVTISNANSVTVQGNETGMAYLVKDSVSVTTLADITGAADDLWNSATITTAGTDTSLSAAGLADGTYKLYVVDAAGNLSSASTGTVTIFDPNVYLSAVAGGTGGFVLNGQAAGDLSGMSVSSAGDMNGDGLADLIVGANGSDPNSLSNAGRSYVIFGSTTGAFANTAVDYLGTSGNDTWTGTASGETAVGGGGDDTYVGNGGADVMYGGSGHDTFVLNADNVAKLAAGVTGGQYARVDGGGGTDTIQLTGGASLDLTAIANQSGSSDVASRISSIEKIDLATDAGANTLTLSVHDVLDMTGMNNFNSGNDWTGAASAVAKHQLVINGGSNDAVVVTDLSNWTDTGTQYTNGGHTYEVYNHNAAAAQLLIETTITNVHG